MVESWMKTSITARVVIIGALTLILLIPSFMIQALIHDRQDRRNEALDEVSEKWGGNQVVSGPILSIPFMDYFVNAEGVNTSRLAYVHILPEDLEIIGQIYPELRRRGIYDVVLYNSDLNLKGHFVMPSFADLKVSPQDIVWSDALMSLGVSDMKGLTKQVVFQVDGETLMANPGIETHDVLASGLSCLIGDISGKSRLDFALDINLNGSDNIQFTPVGKETRVRVQSDWTNPSFDGSFLPAHHTLQQDGFEASWKVLHLNRNFPQAWVGDKNHIQNAAFGVGLLIPVDQYQKTMRTTKYAIMFLGLTFLSFFMIELLNCKVVMHPIQYLLIGFSLLVFYTLLLSISEHISFGAAYIIASLATIVLISAYTLSALKSRKQTLVIFLVLLLLYIYLFIVIQLQDYALLLGSIGLFLILSLVMYLTRKIDWFASFEDSET